MMAYNLNKRNDKNCKGNEYLIRKNYAHMTDKELEYLKNKIDGLDVYKLDYTPHAKNKKLLTLSEIKTLIKFKLFDIIDYNYFMDTKDERVLLRSKKTYKVKNDNGDIIESYCKIVISFNTNRVVTMWMNEVIDEENKQKSLSTKYNNNFDIIKKTIKGK